MRLAVLKLERDQMTPMQWRARCPRNGRKVFIFCYAQADRRRELRHMGWLDRTPKSLKKLKTQLDVTDMGLGLGAQFPAENQRHFARDTRVDLTAAVDAAISDGQGAGALELINAVDQTRDYVIADLRWLDFVSELRRRAEAAIDSGAAGGTP